MNSGYKVKCHEYSITSQFSFFVRKLFIRHSVHYSDQIVQFKILMTVAKNKVSTYNLHLKKIIYFQV